MKKYCKTLSEAKKQYREKTGIDYKNSHLTMSPITIFKLKIGKTTNRHYFVGTYIERINL
jgi:hypothetical protein